MSTEKRLREAITARTSSVEPSPTALHHIKEKLMETQRHSARNRFLGVAAAAAIVAVVVGIALSGDDDGSEIDTTGTTAATTTTTTTPSTTAAPAQVDPTSVVFPAPDTSRRFDDPQALATAFATDVLGFRDLLVGDFQQGDSRSGEVELRAFAAGRPTVVVVRQMEDDTWFVLGTQVESIDLTTPEPGATISSPTPLTGSAWAFEGHVAVRLFADGVTDPIAETFVTGSGDQMGDFTGEMTFEVPDGVEHGVLMLFEASAEDGGTTAATVIRVHF